MHHLDSVVRTEFVHRLIAKAAEVEPDAFCVFWEECLVEERAMGETVFDFFLV